MLQGKLLKYLFQSVSLVSFAALGQHHAHCGYGSKERAQQLRKFLSKGSTCTSMEQARSEFTKPEFDVSCLMSSQLQLTSLKPCKPEQRAGIHRDCANHALGAPALAWAMHSCTLPQESSSSGKGKDPFT